MTRSAPIFGFIGAYPFKNKPKI